MAVVKLAYLAGILTAVCWGFSPILSKRGLSEGGSPLSVALTVVVTGWVLLWGSLLFIFRPSQPVLEASLEALGIFVAGGLFGTAIGRIATYSGVDRLGASINQAVVATNPLFATVLAVIFLHELISPMQAVGIAVVVVGLIVLTISKGGDLGGWERQDLVFPLVAAMSFGGGSVIRRFGLTTTSITAIQGAALNETGALVGLLGYVVVRRRGGRALAPPRSALGYFVLTGVASGLGLVFLFVGLTHGRVAIVATLSGISTMFATGLSYLFLPDLERITRGVVGGSAIVVVGTALITLT